jgi:hypothetical protein
MVPDRGPGGTNVRGPFLCQMSPLFGACWRSTHPTSGTTVALWRRSPAALTLCHYGRSAPGATRHAPTGREHPAECHTVVGGMVGRGRLGTWSGIGRASRAPTRVFQSPRRTPGVSLHSLGGCPDSKNAFTRRIVQAAQPRDGVHHALALASARSSDADLRLDASAAADQSGDVGAIPEPSGRGQGREPSRARRMRPPSGMWPTRLRLAHGLRPPPLVTLEAD